ncbi:MAG: pirin family protein [Oscillospiraceae bacterium]|nr:pirin family protein [Oscillospiraceae bacterium]
MAEIREIKRIVQGRHTVDGAGVKLVRVFDPSDVHDIDPFLMLDAFGSENPDDYIRGFPMHPHRGIETITYLLDGRVDHKDSLGNGGTLLGGDLQWMTAGSGILHEEMPKETKKLDGLQFWLNLPQKDKMAPPHYFAISPDMVKDIDIDHGKIKLIAGRYLEAQGVDSKYAKISMMDVSLDADAQYDLSIPREENAFVYVLEGAASFGEKHTRVEQYSAALFTSGDMIRIKTAGTSVRFVLLAGTPLNEPIAWGGPIVMNTQAELQTAFDELKRGTFIRNGHDV